MSNENTTMTMHPNVPAEREHILTLDFDAPFTPQVKEHFEKAPSLLETTVTGWPGQAVAAIMCLPVVEMAKGLPNSFALFSFGRDTEVVGEIDLENYRHNEVRPHRSDVPEGDEYPGYTVLDGAGRGLADYQLEKVAELVGVDTEEIRIVDVSVGHIDPANPTAGNKETEQSLIERLIDSGLTQSDWTSGRLLFVPPGFGPLGAVMATAIYGLSEVWPKTIRTARDEDGNFPVREIVDPQSLRQFGVELGEKWRSGNAPVTVPRDLFNEVKAEVGDELLAELERLE